jgi:di/tricarboxylate transporter
MSIDIIIVLFIILLAFVLFVSETLPIDVVAITVLSMLLITGQLTPAEGISGFSNPAVITIAILFVLSHALQKTGVLEYLVIKINQLVSRSLVIGLAVYLVSIALASALVNNTAIVAIFMPVTIRMAEKYHISPSKVLMPLSYAAILGGTLTLIGTSTNLLVNSIFVKSGPYTPLGMFEFSRYGIFLLVVGLTYVVLIAYRILPSRTVTSSLTKSYHMGGYLTELKIGDDSPLLGGTTLDRQISQNYDVTILGIQRNKKLLSTNLRETPLEKGDILLVRGSVENFFRMKEVEQVYMLTDEKLNQEELTKEENLLVECLVTNQSELVGQSLKEANFRLRFGSFVLAIRREGDILRKKIAHVILRAFDTLLVYGSREKIREMRDSGGFIVLTELERSLRKHRFWWLSIIVIIGAVLLAALSLVPILKGVIIGLAILLVARVITPLEAYNAINWQIIVLIGCLIPLGIAIQSSGTAILIGNTMVNLLQFVPEYQQAIFLLAMIYLVAMILTEVSSNAATAIIMTPIALAASAKLGLDPRPFIFAICFAASASFITPIGYQTNLMVYGPGGYKFSDYIRVGLPLSITLWVMAVILIPMLWPFTPLP